MFILFFFSPSPFFIFISLSSLFSLFFRFLIFHPPLGIFFFPSLIFTVFPSYLFLPSSLLFLPLCLPLLQHSSLLSPLLFISPLFLPSSSRSFFFRHIPYPLATSPNSSPTPSLFLYLSYSPLPSPILFISILFSLHTLPSPSLPLFLSPHTPSIPLFSSPLSPLLPPIPQLFSCQPDGIPIHYAIISSFLFLLSHGPIYYLSIVPLSISLSIYLFTYLSNHLFLLRLLMTPRYSSTKAYKKKYIYQSYLPSL